MSEAKKTEEMFNQIFGSARGPVAYAMYLCLLHGDTLPKQQFGGVRIEEVQETIRVLRLGANGEASSP